MRRSELFATVSKETETGLECRSAELMVKAGLVKNFGSGTWSYTHLGKKVLDNIEEVVGREMNLVSQEVKMHQLQTSEIWKQSGRWENFEGDEFFTLENRDGKDFTIAATHEEAATALAQDHINSYRDLDLAFYQIGRKFRDDHARKGLLRAKEFIMKDAYSFHRNQEGLNRKYREFLEAYRRIFQQLGLEYSEVEADNGDMGGNRSHEFIAESEEGSDTCLKCVNKACNYGTKQMNEENCGECGSDLEKVNGIEIGHCFQLGDRYTQEDAIGLTYTTESGEEKEVLMASYGIGVSRLISAIIEQNNDENGITWNATVSAYENAVIVARHEDEVRQKAEEIYNALSSETTLFYDDEQSVGEQFAEADLIGINRKIILGNNYLENGEIEIEHRNGDTRKVEGLEELKEVITS
ncbi:MAG: aminoacyl--tRNA ligase-related protein [Candidatus Nanohaloarchaea archaeon]